MIWLCLVKKMWRAEDKNGVFEAVEGFFVGLRRIGWVCFGMGRLSVVRCALSVAGGSACEDGVGVEVAKRCN